jgi:hypothetical protein
LCELACEEIEAGNFSGRVWQPHAYKNIREKYWQRVKLWHPGKEIKNKMTNLKTLYTNWVWLQQQTDRGRGPNGVQLQVLQREAKLSPGQILTTVLLLMAKLRVHL